MVDTLPGAHFRHAQGHAEEELKPKLVHALTLLRQMEVGHALVHQRTQEDATLIIVQWMVDFLIGVDMDHVQDRAEEEFKGEVVYVTTLPRHIMGSHVLEQRYRQKPAILMVVQ